jgi:hypothetical protein
MEHWKNKFSVKSIFKSSASRIEYHCYVHQASSDKKISTLATLKIVVAAQLQSPAVGDFYGTGIEIWAGFGPNGRLSCLHSFKIF